MLLSIFMEVILSLKDRLVKLDVPISREKLLVLKQKYLTLGLDDWPFFCHCLLFYLSLFLPLPITFSNTSPIVPLSLPLTVSFFSSSCERTVNSAEAYSPCSTLAIRKFFNF